MAQPTTQSTPTWISLREARALVTRRLSSALAEKLLVEGLDRLDAKRIKWRHGHIENNSGVSTETALDGFWRLASINWEASWAARRVEPRMVAAARRGVLPGGIVAASLPARPPQPVSQLGANFVVYGIDLAREDVELLLREYGEPTFVAEPAPSSSASLAEPAPLSSASVAEPAPPSSRASVESQSKRQVWKGKKVREALQELYPDGVPPRIELSDSALCSAVYAHLGIRDDKTISRITILRHAGRAK